MLAGLSDNTARRPWLCLCAFAAIYFAAAELGHLLSFPGDFASFWPPSGLYLAALLATGRSFSLPVSLAALAGNLTSDVFLHGKPVAVAVAFWVGNTLEATIGAALVRRLSAGAEPWGVRWLVVTFAVAAPVSTAVSATIGSATVWTAFGGGYADIWVRWWVSGLVGVFVALHAASAAFSPSARRRGVFLGRNREAACAVAVCGVVAVFVFSQPWPVGWLTTAVLLWPAMRLGHGGVSACVWVIATVAVWQTARETGPFGALAPDAALVVVQVFISVHVLLFQTLAAMTAESTAASAAASESLERLRDLFDNMAEAVVVVGADGRLVLSNAALGRLLGRGEDDLKSVPLSSFVHPGDSPALAAALRDLSAAGGRRAVEWRVVTKTGSVLTLEGEGSAGQDAAVRFILRDVTEERRAAAEVARLHDEARVRVEELERAMAAVRELRGLLPMCAWCKRVRDDADYWQDLESYIAANTNASVTHGICPHCEAKFLADYAAARGA